MTKATANIGDRVRMSESVGWGCEGKAGIVTRRAELAGAEQLGELSEVTFPDGFVFWVGDDELEIIATADRYAENVKLRRDVPTGGEA